MPPTEKPGKILRINRPIGIAYMIPDPPGAGEVYSYAPSDRHALDAFELGDRVLMTLPPARAAAPRCLTGMRLRFPRRAQR